MSEYISEFATEQEIAREDRMRANAYNIQCMETDELSADNPCNIASYLRHVSSLAIPENANGGDSAWE